MAVGISQCFHAAHAPCEQSHINQRLGSVIHWPPDWAFLLQHKVDPNWPPHATSVKSKNVVQQRSQYFFHNLFPCPVTLNQFYLTFLSSFWQKLIFPALDKWHPTLWRHSLSTNRSLDSFSPCCFQMYFIWGRVEGRAFKHQQRRRHSQISKLVGGGHWQIGPTQKHSSSLPHTCWSVLFGFESMW